jgi:sugar phosphate isomerase/epimerase
MTWRFGISTGACTDAPILDMLPILRQSGATAVEIGTPPRHFDPWQANQIAALHAKLDELVVAPVSIHAPFGGLLDLAEPNPHHRNAAIGAVLTAADAIRQLGGQMVVVHPSDLPRQDQHIRGRLDDCADSLRTLEANCADVGITLVVETPLPHLVAGHPDEFAWLLSRLGPAVGVCIDTGHAALGGHWHRLVTVAGARLMHIHANDNRGSWDDHLPPGDGAINWSEIATSLRAVSFQGWIMLELHCPDADPAEYFRRALRQAARLFGDGPTAPAPAASQPSRA